MKKIYLLFVVAIISLSFLFVQCLDPVNVLVENNSDKAIGCYISSYYYGENSLPESEPDIQYAKRIEPGKYFYDSSIEDPSTLYIFDSDTLEKYTWKEIREGDKYLGKYNIGYCNLRTDPKLHYRIKYPEIEKLCCDTCLKY